MSGSLRRARLGSAAILSSPRPSERPPGRKRWTRAPAVVGARGRRGGGPYAPGGNAFGLGRSSLPYFVMGMPLLVVFGTGLRWFPVSGMLKLGAQYTGPFDRPLDFLAHFALPVTTTITSELDARSSSGRVAT